MMCLNISVFRLPSPDEVSRRSARGHGAAAHALVPGSGAAGGHDRVLRLVVHLGSLGHRGRHAHRDRGSTPHHASADVRVGEEIVSHDQHSGP